MNRFGNTSNFGGSFGINGFETRNVEKVPFINKVILTEAKPYKKQWLRPLTTSFDRGDLASFKDIVRDKVIQGQTNNFITNNLVNKLSHTASISERAVAQAPIVNGWEEKRFKFALEIEWKIKGTQKSYIEYIQGYTDYFGYSQLNGGTGKIDENMRFFPNSILRVIKNIGKDGLPKVRVVGNYKLVKDETGVMRDFQIADHTTVISEVGAQRRAEAGVDVYSNTTDFTSGSVIKKELNIPILYISSLIEKLIETASTLGNEFSVDDEVYKDLLNNIDYNYLQNIEFLKWLVNYKGSEFYWFTLNELKVLDRFVDKKVTPIISGPMEQRRLGPDTLDTAETHDTSYETKAAVTIHESLNDLMTQNFLESVAFTATNISGQFTYNINNAAAVVEGLNPLPFFDNFINMFHKYVWLPLSQHEQTMMSIDVISYIEGDTIVTVSIESDIDHGIIYRFPSFASSKFSPIIMDNNNIKQNASVIGDLVDIGTQEVETIQREAATLAFNPNTLNDIY